MGIWFSNCCEADSKLGEGELYFFCCCWTGAGMREMKQQLNSVPEALALNTCHHLRHYFVPKVIAGSVCCAYKQLGFWSSFSVWLLVLPCSQASLAEGYVFISDFSVTTGKVCPAHTLALKLVRELLNQEATTTTSGSSAFSLLWSGSGFVQMLPLRWL